MKFIVSHTRAKDGLINARIQTLDDNGMNHCGFITVQPDEWELLELILRDGGQLHEEDSDERLVEIVNFNQQTF